jgi:hypothetical protein
MAGAKGDCEKALSYWRELLVVTRCPLRGSNMCYRLERVRGYAACVGCSNSNPFGKEISVRRNYC